MKRKLMGLLCICMLLSGCRVRSTPAEQTEPPATEASATQPNELPPLLEQGRVPEGSGNLLQIPNETVAGMEQPEMHLLGNGLLLHEYTDRGLALYRISLETGAQMGSGLFSVGPGTKLVIGSGELGLCDRESGQVCILDEHFRVLRTYAVTAEGDDWYLNPELDTLYIFFSDRGVAARNLETGEVRWLVDNGIRVTGKGSGPGYVIFEYTDREDQKTNTRCLNLSTATLETLPISSWIAEGSRQGEGWLLRSYEADGVYFLIQNESVCSFTWTESPVRLLAPRQHLLMMDSSGRNLTLYDQDGSFLSCCALPQNSMAVVGTDFVWSGYWDGYFFMDFLDGAWQLMFWDVWYDTEGEDLQMLSLEAAQQPQSVVEPQLYEKARQLSQRFGVDIRIAEQCSLDYSHYDTYALTTPYFIRSALELLEESLSQYPEGFFYQLRYGSVKNIRIELVGELTIKDNINTHPPTAAGFVSYQGSYNTIVLDGSFLQSHTIFHELSHIIDRKIEWEALDREDALYSEEAWLALQPEGFRYAMSYAKISQEQYDAVEPDYFLTTYCMTFPTEDRAVLMAAAMAQETWRFEVGSGNRAKLQFYADCIRDCFHTDGWPETAPWEQVLK